MVTVRPIDPTEAAELRTIRLAALAADPTAFGRTHAEEAAFGQDHWTERAAGSDTSQAFVAVLHDEFVGLCGAYLPDSDGAVELVSMWTAPTARGRGVGRLLVEAVVEWAARHAPPAVELWVTRGNEPAIALYTSCGFELTDDVIASPADPCREELRMHRSLQRDSIA